MARPLLIETIRVVDGHRTQVSVYFLKQHTNLSLAEIAVIFGKSSRNYRGRRRTKDKIAFLGVILNL
jgi:hypothetical protein